MLLNSSKAEAFLGIGENSDEVYKADTVRYLACVVSSVPEITHPRMWRDGSSLESITLTSCVQLQSKILEQVRTAISLGKEDAAREAAMEDVRKATMDWVAKYRRAGFTGRPSYGCILVQISAIDITAPSCL